MKKENQKYWRLGILFFALFMCAGVGIKQRSLILWLGSSAVICLLMTPYLIADWRKKKEMKNSGFHKDFAEFVQKHISGNSALLDVLFWGKLIGIPGVFGALGIVMSLMDSGVTKRKMIALIACICAMGVALLFEKLEEESHKVHIVKEIANNQVVNEQPIREICGTRSEVFAKYAVYDLIDKQRIAFEQIVRSADTEKLKSFFFNEYYRFVYYPETIEFTYPLNNRGSDDTKPTEWCSEIIPLIDGDYAVLLYIPILIKEDTLTARIVGVILSDKGDGYYYCTLSENENKLSTVIRKGTGGKNIEKIGEVKGFGSELLQSFLNCIRDSFYKDSIIDQPYIHTFRNWEDDFERSKSIREKILFIQLYTRIKEIPVLKFKDYFSLDDIAQNSISFDGFLSGISQEMCKAGIRLNEMHENEAYYCFTCRFDLLSPEKIAWFYMLLYKEKVVHFLNHDQLCKLNSLLETDDSELRKKAVSDTNLPEKCMIDLMKIKKYFIDSECSEFNWEYAVSVGWSKDSVVEAYAYYMDSTRETALKETEKALNEMCDSKLKAWYPGWAISVSQGKVCMFRHGKMELEEWLSFEHPFFKEHSRNPVESAKQYYKLFHYSLESYLLWGFPESIQFKSNELNHQWICGKEDSQELTIDYHEQYSYHDGGGGFRHLLKFAFVSDEPDSDDFNTDDCEVPCKGWYDKEGRRYLIDPMEMTGIFEFCHIDEVSEGYY